MQIARYFKKVDDVILCELCPQNCRIKSDGIGLCRERKNVDGTLVALNYGQITSLHVDPIEKKPLYHFLPGQQILSIGNNGCNLKCSFCQNWSISQMKAPTEKLDPEDVIRAAKNRGLNSVAFTYAEPMVWYEYVLETCKLLKVNNMHSVLVTNGLISVKPLQELLPYVDAMNIDIKSMDERFYRKLCKGPLQPVLETCAIASKSCHVEVTNLVITDENDTEDMFELLADFIGTRMSPQTPLHFSRYYPQFQLQNPQTAIKTLMNAKSIAEKRLQYVYVGNLPDIRLNSTFCPHCKRIIIERTGASFIGSHLTQFGDCPGCGMHLPIKMSS